MNKQRVSTIAFKCVQTADQVTVTNLRTGKTEDKGGGTNFNIVLDAKYKFFKRAKYSVLFKKTGFDSKTYIVTPKVSGWYWGNIPLGVVWMFVVDPATGSMYRMKPVSIEVDFLSP